MSDRMTALDEPERDRYLYGDCSLLALAVHERTGWPVVLLLGDPETCDGHEGEPETCEIAHGTRHVLVRMPDGRLLDAAGPHAYSGETPFRPESWRITEGMWRRRDVLAHADELLRRIGWPQREAQ